MSCESKKGVWWIFCQADDTKVCHSIVQLFGTSDDFIGPNTTYAKTDEDDVHGGEGIYRADEFTGVGQFIYVIGVLNSRLEVNG